jgi:hypothetical protein
MTLAFTLLITKLESHVSETKERYLVSIIWSLSLSGVAVTERAAGLVRELSDRAPCSLVSTRRLSLEFATFSAPVSL